MRFRRNDAERIVQSRVLSYLKDNPQASLEEARASLSAELRDDFSGSPNLQAILEALLKILPIIMALFSSNQNEPV